MDRNARGLTGTGRAASPASIEQRLGLEQLLADLSARYANVRRESLNDASEDALRQLILRATLIGGLALAFSAAATSAFAAAEPQSAAKNGLGSCAAYGGLPTDKGETAGMAFIAGGTFKMGSERHQPEERFTHSVRVDGFWIDRHEVTNAQFKQFVDATGYRTLAERGLDPKAHPDVPKDLLVPGSVVLIPPNELKQGGRITQW